MLATLGLALNSTAVVIGAMLIAPLMRPIVDAGRTVHARSDRNRGGSPCRHRRRRSYRQRAGSRAPQRACNSRRRESACLGVGRTRCCGDVCSRAPHRRDPTATCAGDGTANRPPLLRRDRQARPRCLAHRRDWRAVAGLAGPGATRPSAHHSSRPTPWHLRHPASGARTRTAGRQARDQLVIEEETLSARCKHSSRGAPTLRFATVIAGAQSRPPLRALCLHPRSHEAPTGGDRRDRQADLTRALTKSSHARSWIVASRLASQADHAAFTVVASLERFEHQRYGLDIRQLPCYKGTN